MNMIEKVARAIEENVAAALPAGVTVDYRYAALASIEAMREPTPEMLEAAIDWHDHVEAEETYPMARGVMRAAIGAALDEK